MGRPHGRMDQEAVQAMDAIVEARQVLHAVAEHLLAGPQWRHTGELALMVTPHGFRTTAPAAPGLSAIEVQGAFLAVEPAGITIPIGGSVRELAAALGIEPGAPADLYTEHAALTADDRLKVDNEAIGVVLDALIAGDEALTAMDSGERPLLWPEHFDVGISLGSVNYGVSPGDPGHDRPYAYVGPSTPLLGNFWNEPFGASRSLDDLRSANGILAFFQEGRRQAASTP